MKNLRVWVLHFFPAAKTLLRCHFSAVFPRMQDGDGIDDGCAVPHVILMHESREISPEERSVSEERSRQGSKYRQRQPKQTPPYESSKEMTGSGAV